jgi:hypothetical protein
LASAWRGEGGRLYPVVIEYILTCF